MNEFNKRIDEFLERSDDFNELEGLFDMQQSSARELGECAEELVLLRGLWDTAKSVQSTFESWNDILWEKIDTEDLLVISREINTQVKATPKQARTWPLYNWLTAEVKNMS